MGQEELQRLSSLLVASYVASYGWRDDIQAAMRAYDKAETSFMVSFTIEVGR